jgi:hypothetical protein
MYLPFQTVHSQRTGIIHAVRVKIGSVPRILMTLRRGVLRAMGYRVAVLP